MPAKKIIKTEIKKDENTLREELKGYFTKTKSIQDILGDFELAEKFELTILAYKREFEINKKILIKKLNGEKK